MSSEDTQYFFRKLKSKIYTLCFFSENLEQLKLKDLLNFNLIKALFMADSNFKNKFIHFMNTQKEVSLFLDKKTLDIFLHNLPSELKECIIMDNTCFRAAEIYSLQNDLNSTGITSFISNKLAMKNIPIIYNNSFNSSFILVPEKYLSEANVIFKSIAENREDDDEDEDQTSLDENEI